MINRQRGKVGRKLQAGGGGVGGGGGGGGSKKRDRNLPIVIGKSIATGLMSLRGADLTVARYVGRLALGTTAEQLRALLEERGVSVVSCEAISSKRLQPSFTSFKLVVKKTQLAMIEKDDFWPDGVIVGRYWSPKTTSEISAAAGNLSTNLTQ